MAAFMPWVADPDLVPICQEVFDKYLGGHSNQLDIRRDDVQVALAQLLDVSAVPGTQTEAGLRNNVHGGLRYLEADAAGVRDSGLTGDPTVLARR